MDQAPEYFKLFVTKYDENNCSTNTRLDTMNNSLQSMQQTIQTSESRRDREREQDRQEVEALRQHSILTDRCEIVVYGLSRTTILSNEAAAARLLAFLSLPQSFAADITCRDWKANIRQYPPNSANPNNPNNVPPPFKAFVIRLPNPSVRNRVMEVSGRLRSVTSNEVFGEGGNYPVSLQPLWPAPVHSLFLSAIRASAYAKYARPVVVNMVVCLRKDLRSPLIPIFSLSELQSHIPPPTNTPPTAQLSAILTDGPSTSSSHIPFPQVPTLLNAPNQHPLPPHVSTQFTQQHATSSSTITSATVTTNPTTTTQTSTSQSPALPSFHQTHTSNSNITYNVQDYPDPRTYTSPSPLANPTYPNTTPTQPTPFQPSDPSYSS